MKKIPAHLFLLVGIPSLLSGQISTSEITAEELKAHVKYLADDDLEGRASGSEGNKKAGQYIADRMKEYGLKPGGENGSYFQSFDFVAGLTLGEQNEVVIQSKGNAIVLKIDRDFRPFGFSTNGTVSGSLVFAGYGISTDEYDDYRDLDVQGKIVVVLRYGPQGNDPHSKLFRHTTFRSKARTAREKGAKALVMIPGPLDDAEDGLVKLTFDNPFSSSGIIALTMKRAALVPLFSAEKRDLREIQQEIRQKNTPITFTFKEATATVKAEVHKVMSNTANVLGYIEGNDPELRDQVIVIGAHMDHLGYGGPGSGSLMPDTHAIHNGADDNASGTAGLLELQQAFAAERSGLKRTLLFIAFSAEELGTLGSSHYAAHPKFPIEKTVAMINLDMVGRLKDNSLTVYGTGTSSDWEEMLDRHNNVASFSLKKIPDGFGPSDHSQFYAKEIPVLFFFTGTHGDYHKPSDDWDKLNYDGQEKIIRFIRDITRNISERSARPTFTRAPSTMAMRGDGDTRGFSVTLGVIPDYGEGTEGMKIGGTRPNGPAEKAGLQAGDIIVKMAGKRILNIYDYMDALGELRAGDEVDVEVRREGAVLKFMVKMEKR